MQLARLYIVGTIVLAATSVIGGDSLRIDFWRPSYLKDAAEAEPREGAGSQLSLTFDRSFARAGERWIIGRLEAHPRGRPLKDTRLRARLFALGSLRPLAEVTVRPERSRGRVLIDLRSHGLSEARVSVEFLAGGEALAAAEAFVSARPCEKPLRPGRRVQVHMDVPEPAGAIEQWPVTFGVPFAPGALWDVSELRLVDEAGAEVPCQKEVTARWAPEGAIQWVRFGAAVNPQRGCFLEMAQAAAKPQMPVALSESGDGLVLSIGRVRYVLGKGLSPIREVWLGEQRVASSAGTRGLYTIDQRGRVANASAEGETMEVEAAGPVTACIRFEGFYRTSDGEQLARHITRIEALAGQPFANVTHTLVITSDTNRVWFQEIGWEFAVRAGAGPKAVFNTARDDPARTIAHPLTDAGSAFMLQDSHFQFGAGKNHCRVATGEKTLAEGEECGDWAMLQGKEAAFLLHCRESARQHPKEFEVAANRVNLKLYSHRSGEELDFRTPTLARKWGLPEDKAAEVATLTSNAVGWAKTHELCLAPLPAAGAAEAAACVSARHTWPIQALIDPHWIRESQALRWLHPRDTDRFADTERVIESFCRCYAGLALEPGHYGFRNYYAGPTYWSGANYSKRYKLTYGLRAGLWLAYARSGERWIREFAEGTNKAFADNWLAHWDGAKTKKGLYFLPDSGKKNYYPFFWGDLRAFEISSSTDLNQFLWLYQLTGYRRAKDIVLDFAEGLKRAWRPGMHSWRLLMVYRVLTQAYAFTGDPELGAMAEATFDTFYDAETELGLTKHNRPYKSTTYKLGVDVRALIDGWEAFGNPKCEDVLSRIARTGVPCVSWPIAYMHPFGFLGAYVYDRSGNPATVASLEYAIRQANVAVDPESGEIRPGTHSGMSSTGAILDGLPYAMDVLARSGALEKRPSSWLAFRDYGFPTSIVAFKGNEETLDVTVAPPKRDGVTGEAGGIFEVAPLGQKLPWGLDQNWIRMDSNCIARIHVPKDAPEGAYQIRYAPQPGGTHRADYFVTAHSRAPLVLHAPTYWQLPHVRPGATVYFKVPEDAKDAQVFLEGRAQLLDPEGKPFGDPKGVHGWVDLPADKPGLWSFKPIENQLVRVRNLPPFFAMHEPESHFEPPLEWQREDLEPRTARKIPQDAMFVAADSYTPGREALFLGGNNTFTLSAGPADPNGDGGQFLPHQEGTVEFFFRPSWSTFDIGPGAAIRSLLRVQTDKSPWELVYRIDPLGTTIFGGPRGPAHSLFGNLYVEGAKPYWLRQWMPQTLIERDKWIHLAYVWGRRPSYGPHGEKLSLMALHYFLNGKGAKRMVFRVGYDGALPHGMPKALTLGPFQGAVDELRISDTQRYEEDFAPPTQGTTFNVDEHTRALFHFDGDLKGLSHRTAGPVSGAITPSSP